MYKRCTTEKGCNLQKQFENTLLSLMQQIPYDAISVRKLCDIAGITRKTFYRIFTDKESVLCALIDRVYAEFLTFDFPDSTLSPNVSRELQIFFHYWKEQKPLLDALLANEKRGLLIKCSLLHVFREENTTIYRLGAENSPYSREMVLFHIGGIMTLVLDWHQSGYQKPVPEMAELLHSLLINPPIRNSFPTDHL